MNHNRKIDDYINGLPEWQQNICNQIRTLIHIAEKDIQEEIKFTNRPYFTFSGNVCAFLATKSHVNIFIYDPTASDPQGIINQGHQNKTARSIQITKGFVIDDQAFIDLIKEVVSNNKKGGWRKL